MPLCCVVIGAAEAWVVCVMWHLQFELVENDSGAKRRERAGGGVPRKSVVKSVPLVTRLQDRELQEMRDDGRSCDNHVTPTRMHSTQNGHHTLLGLVGALHFNISIFPLFRSDLLPKYIVLLSMTHIPMVYWWLIFDVTWCSPDVTWLTTPVEHVTMGY